MLALRVGVVENSDGRRRARVRGGGREQEERPFIPDLTQSKATSFKLR